MILGSDLLFHLTEHSTADGIHWQQSSKAEKSGKTSKKNDQRAIEGKGVGGLRGMLSSARSLGWGKRKGGEGEDDQVRERTLRLA